MPTIYVPDDLRDRLSEEARRAGYKVQSGRGSQLPVFLERLLDTFIRQEAQIQVEELNQDKEKSEGDEQGLSPSPEYIDIRVDEDTAWYNSALSSIMAGRPTLQELRVDLIKDLTLIANWRLSQLGREPVEKVSPFKAPFRMVVIDGSSNFMMLLNQTVVTSDQLYKILKVLPQEDQGMFPISAYTILDHHILDVLVIEKESIKEPKSPR